jgi:16S rRNA (uracil1498-N3)-methyltransferase
VEREHRSILTLFAPQAFAAGSTLRLEDDAAQHAHVRRVRSGEPVRLLDGAGSVGAGVIESMTRRAVEVRIEDVTRIPRPTTLEVVVPVADRDRMLLAAEKCVELQVTAWRPTYFARSRSVATRGEGERFRAKVVARMRAALEQSGGAWLPEIHEEADARTVFESIRVPHRFMLDAGGQPLRHSGSVAEAAIAVGPEGGCEVEELNQARSAGWMLTSLGASTLRFETAIIAGLAVIRAGQSILGRS